MLASQETKINQQVQDMLADQRKAISAMLNAQQKALLSQQFPAMQTDKQKKKEEQRKKSTLHRDLLSNPASLPSTNFKRRSP